MAQAKQDMGTGSIKKLMLQLMIPAVVAQVVNLLYNIVDRIYIGHIAGIGAAALTGVGLFTPILMLLNAFAMLVGAGGAPRTAIALGQGDRQQAEKIVSNSFTVLMFFAVVLTIGFYAGAPVLLRLFGASDATLPYALSYSRIYIAGSVFVLVVLGMNPFITTQGFAKTSMLTTVIGAVINIILDPILIFGFGLGVRGAAIATVLSQAVGAAWIIRFLTGKKTILRLRRDYLRPEKQIILPVLALGIGVQNLPEGLAVGLPFRAGGMSRGRSFALGALSGAVENLKAAAKDSTVVDIAGVGSQIHAIDIALLQIPCLDKLGKVDKVGVARTGRERLIGRIAIAGRRKGQNLPVMLFARGEKIDEVVGIPSKAADSVWSGQR